MITPVMNPLTLAAGIAALFLSASLFSHTVALRLLLLLLGIALAAAAVVREGRSLRILPPIWIAFALWGAWQALSLFWSYEPDRTLKELRNELGYSAAALWICFVGAQARNAARIILPVVGAAAVLASISAIYLFPQGIGPYSTGWHGGAGNFSSALLTMMPCLLMAGWYAGRSDAPRWQLMLITVLAALFFVDAYTTLNRTVWLGFAVQLLVLGGLMFQRRRATGNAPIRMRTKLIAGALAVGVAAGGVAMTLRVHAEREEIGSTRALDEDPRLVLWPKIVDLMVQRPLTGYGFGRGIMRAPLREEFGTYDFALWHTHNIFLEAVIQAGVPGLLLLLLLLGATLREGWRYAKDPDDAKAAAGIALIAVVAGMLMRNMTDVLWLRQNALFYWGVVGVLLAWGGRRAE